jgi:hypothetical protein
MRRALLAALTLLLAGCADGNFNPILVGAVQEVLPGERAPQDAPAGAGVTRAAITRADTATIRARLVGDKTPTYLFAASDNGGYVTYASGIRQTVTLRGSWITGSRGLGWDLLSALSSRPDPLTQPIPLSQWPEVVQRSYEFPAFAPQGEILSYECRFAFGAIEAFEILAQSHRGVLVTETCQGDAGSFENLHFADVQSGFVWRSLQWLGPKQGMIDLEVVLPYTGRRT